MKFSFQHSDVQSTGYDVTGLLNDADFAVVDADSKAAIDRVVSAGRTGSAVFVGTHAPAGAAVHLRRPIDPTRILKALGQLVARHVAPVLDHVGRDDRGRGDDEDTTPSARVSANAAVARTAASASQQAAPEVAASAGHKAGPVGEKNVDLSRRDAKAAKRGAVRRARLSRSEDTPGAGVAMPQDVLVLDADPSTSAQLHDLLDRFGFGVVVVCSVEEARRESTGRVFVAHFLDIALDSADALDLLVSIRAQAMQKKRAEPEVFMVASQLEPADRVRAALAGIGTPLLKPVTRGDLARALEGRGVSLPADARRG